jgi:ferredoxin
LKDIITIYVTDLSGKEHKVDAPTNMGLSLMEVIKANVLPIKALCGGMTMCASCNIILKSEHSLPEMTDDEEAMLDEAFVLDTPNSRLSCQIRVTEELDGLHVQLGKLTDPEA